LKRKLAAANDAPNEVFKDFAFLFGAGIHQQRQDLAGFVCRGESGKGAPRRLLLRSGGVIREVFSQATDSVISDGKFLIHGVAVGKVQHLDKAGFIGTFAFTGDAALVSAWKVCRNHDSTAESLS
jgi:hypothetical protein